MVKRVFAAMPYSQSPQRKHEKEVSTKYLGNNLSTSGSLHKNIEDRRNKGWGKISSIMGILGEVDMGVHQLEAGPRLREAILI